MTEQHLLLAAHGRSLSKTESLSLVQIFLNASLACLAHTRELIPWMSPCLRTRYIDHIDPSVLVSDGSLYAELQALEPKDVAGGQEIRILVRGGHKRADQILEMLENGVFEALAHGYLDTLQVFLTSNDDHPPSVLETYCFAFSYEHGRVTSIELSPTDHAFVLGHFQKSFKAAIRALLRSLKDLPRLPARRKLGMSLTYKEKCPDNYQPPGFMDKDDLEGPNRQLLAGVLRPVVGDTVGRLDTGHHQVNIGVCRWGSQHAEILLDPQDAVMSKQLQAMQKTSSIQSTDLVSTLRDSRSGKRQNGFPIPSGKRQKFVVAGNPLSEEPVKPGKKQSGPPRTPVMSTEMSEASLAHASLAPRASSTLRHGPSLIISKLVELLVHAYAIHRGVPGGSGNVFDEDLLAEGVITRKDRSSRVRCECGSAAISGRLVYCDVCDNWQHAKCYGYERTSSDDQPAERFCYTCLLFPADKDIAHSPAYIISMRMAIETLASQKRPSWRPDKEKLQRILRPLTFNNQILDAVVGQLTADGIFSTRDGQVDEAVLQELLYKYGNPFASIDHLYDWDAGAKDPRQRSYGIARAFDNYARGQDYTRAQGCVEIMSTAQFGEPVSRWGYVVEDTTASDFEASTSLCLPATPARRRKVSISRLLINLDCSPSTASMSFEESSLQVLDDTTYSSNFSPASSTATAD